MELLQTIGPQISLPPHQRATTVLDYWIPAVHGVLHLERWHQSAEAGSDQTADGSRRGKMHLRFVLSLYTLQLREGRYFLHEHPAYATSWRDHMMERLPKRSDVDTRIGHQCRGGLFVKKERWLHGFGSQTYAMG